MSQSKSPVSFLERNQRTVSHNSRQVLFLINDYVEISVYPYYVKVIVDS